jgi:hypothetical protein
MNIRIVLTILNYSRAILPNKKEMKLVKPDYSSISNPYSGKD